MHWFKKHAEFLRQESNALSNNSNYQEIHQCRDNVFLSHGNILVRLDKVYRHPVLIIYTDATPYQLPLIFPLKVELTVQEVTVLAKLTIGQICSSIKPRVIYYHHLRHQNRGGNLCILETAELDGGAKFYNIGSILQRVRDWFAGHVTGNFPPDNQEVEFCAHFNSVNRTLEFLYPNSFLDQQLIAGQFYATQIRHFEGKHFIYYGSLIDGISESGIQTNGTYLLNELVHESLKASVDFQIRGHLVDSLVESKKLLNGIWFHIETILTPFEGFNELVKIIGNGNHDTGVQRFVKTALHFFKKLHDKFVVGVRYPNKRGELEFQLFEVKVSANLKDEIFLGPDSLQKMESILKRYETVSAIWSEELTAESFHLRNSLRAKHEVLSQMVVNLIGVGSLGSEIVDCLAKAGIGNINLIDNQEIRAHNSVRHVAGFGYIGIPKSNAMKDVMLDHNLFVSINASTLNVFAAPDLMLCLPDKSITVSSIADDNVEAFINEQAVIAGKTVFYSRSLRGGKVGRIFRVTPGNDACFQCLSLYLNEKYSKFRIDEDEAFPILKNECNNPIRPASAADLKIIASITARLVIDHLQQGSSAHNHWIWSTEELPTNQIDTPYSLKPGFLPPHPNCYYCNTDKKLTVIVNKDVVQFMQKLVEEKKGIETGGVLAGIVDPSGNIHITCASEPGAKAIHKTTQFRKDIEFCQAFLDKIYVESGQKIVYVGEWHSHPDSDNRPSGLDILSLSEISQQKEYLTSNPVMIIFSSTGIPSCTIHPAGKAHYFTELGIIEKSIAA